MRSKQLLAAFAVGSCLVLLGCGNEPKAAPGGSLFGVITVAGAKDNSAVRVSVEDKLVTTDDSGHYEFNYLTVGDHTLHVARDGFEPIDQPFSVAAGERKELNLTLARQNLAPVIASITAQPSQLVPGGTSEIEVSASDPDGDALTVEFTADNAFTVSPHPENALRATVTAPTTADAQGTLTVKVSDDRGGSTTGRINLSTRPNTLPLLSSLTAVPPIVSPSGTIVITGVATDADADALTWQWTVPTGWAGSSTSDTLTLTAPATFGENAIVSVKVVDSRGGETTGRITVGTSQNAAPVITSLTSTPPQARSGGTLDLEVFAYDPDGEALTYTWAPPQGWTLAPVDGGVIDSSHVRLTAPNAYGVVGHVGVTVSDPSGASVSAQLVVSTAQSAAPVLSSLTASPPLVDKGQTATLHASASDPDGDPLTYAWTAPAGWTIAALSDGGVNTGPTVSILAPNLPGQSASVDLTVSDGHGGTALGSVVVSTSPNHAPQLATLTASPSSTFRGTAISLLASASDPDGDALTYAWSVDQPSWTFTGTPTGADATITAPGSYSSVALVTVTITDAFGGSVSGSVLVSTNPDRAPSITTTPPAAQPIAGRAVWRYPLSATDPDGDTLTFSAASGSPPWASIISGNTLRLSPAISATGSSYSVTVQVSDGASTASQTLNGTVQPFAMRTIGSTNTLGEDVEAADLNGDQKTDLVSLGNDGTISVSFANGTGLSTGVSYPDTADTVSGCGALGTGDIDGDGDRDVVIGCMNARPNNTVPFTARWAIVPFLNDGTGVFTRGTYSQDPTNGGGSEVWYLTVGDLTGDGKADVAVSVVPGFVTTWKSVGAGAFTRMTYLNVGAGNDFVHGNMQIANVAGSPDADLILAVYNNGSNSSQLSVIQGDGTGALVVASEQRTPAVPGAQFSANVLADFDKDGDLDFACVQSGGGTIYLYKNTGGGTFVANGALPFNGGSFQRCLAVADMDSDGNLDLIASNYNAPATVLFGDGTGAFPNAATADVGGTTSNSYVFAADWNRDGAADLIWTTSSGGAGVSY